VGLKAGKPPHDQKTTNSSNSPPKADEIPTRW
jgi:hypothetical protein